METRNDKQITKTGLMALFKGHKIIVGKKQLRKAMNANRVNMVVLARNADFAITEPLEAICLENHIPFTWVPSMTDLGHACGIDVGAAAAAVVDETDSTGILP